MLESTRLPIYDDNDEVVSYYGTDDTASFTYREISEAVNNLSAVYLAICNSDELILEQLKGVIDLLSNRINEEDVNQ